MPVVPFIPAIITAGGALGGAALAAHGQGSAANAAAAGATDAAKIAAASQDKATAAQLSATQAALQFQRDTMANKVAAMQPYASLGLGALADLGRGYGFSTTDTPIPSVPPVPKFATGVVNSQGIDPGTGLPPGWITGGSATDPSHNTLPVPGAPTAAPTATNPTANLTALSPVQTQTRSSFTPMVSPDGTERAMVPNDQVPTYLARGARVLNG